MVANLSKLKGMGFNYLGMEAFRTTDQPILDQFMQGRASSEDLLQVLDAVQYIRSWEYVKVVEAAKRAGIKVIALDMPHGQKDSESPKRDLNMVAVVQKIFQNDAQARVVMFTGAAHAAWGKASQRSILQNRYHLSSLGIYTCSPSVENKFDFFHDFESIDQGYNKEPLALITRAYFLSGMAEDQYVRFPKELGKFEFYVFHGEKYD